MSHQSAAPSSGSNSIPFADQTIGRFTSGLPRRSRRLQSGTPCTPVRPYSSPPPVEPSEFHGVDPATIPYINDDPDWVDASIPVLTPAFQTPPVADHNPINNQLAKALRQLLENLNRGSTPKPHQSKAHIPDTFDGSDPHKLNHFLFQCQLFFYANPSQSSIDEEKINFAMTYLLSRLGKMAKSLFIFLFLFFSFLIGLTTTRWSTGKYHVTLSQWCDRWSCHRSQLQCVT